MKNVNTKLIICLIVLLLQNTFSFAQETIQQYKSRLTAHELRQVDFTRPINITSDEDGKYTIIFSDANKGQVIRTFDVRENNPFAELGNKTDNQYADVFSVENKTLGELFPDIYLNPSIYKSIIDDTMQIEGFYVDYGAKFSNNRQFAFVTYSAVPIPGEFNRTAFLFFDSTGVEISRHTLDVPTGQTLITDDGEYFAIVTGWTSEFDYQTFIDYGFAVFNVKTADLLLYKEFDAISGVGNVKNFIVAGSHPFYNSTNERVVFNYIIDLENQKIYSRELDADCIGFSEIVSDGFIMNCLNGVSYKLKFIGDFKVEDLK
jgi:hypothetical protein